MKDRFDLEEEIMKLYAFVDNIDDAIEYLIDSDVDPKVTDAMSNILLGTSTLLGLHAEKMLDTMRQCFKLDQYREDITSELSVKAPLTDADNRVITKCSGNCHTRTSSECSGKFYSDTSTRSFEYQ